MENLNEANVKTNKWVPKSAYVNEYHKNYYHANNDAVICGKCGSKVMNKYKLSRHMKTSKCMKITKKNEMKDEKQEKSNMKPSHQGLQDMLSEPPNPRGLRALIANASEDKTIEEILNDEYSEEPMIIEIKYFKNNQQEISNISKKTKLDYEEINQYLKLLKFITTKE